MIPKRIPTHVIAGPLGVGKTTAIIDYCRRHAGQQFTAVLVNDFGPLGLDGLTIESDSGSGANLQVATIPGGCVCCEAAVGLMTGLQKMARDPRVDRIIIEPSGVAMPAMIVDQLRIVARDEPVDLRPTMVMLDVRQHAKAGLWDIPYFRAMIDAADVLIANRVDQTTPAAVDQFAAWTRTLYPPKLRVITTHHGQIPDDVFDLSAAPASPEHHQHHHVHLHPHAGGYETSATGMYDLDRLTAALQGIVKGGIAGVKVDRLKGVFHCDEGWYLLEIAAGQVECRRSEYRRSNRMDWITLEGKVPQDAMAKRIDAARIVM